MDRRHKVPWDHRFLIDACKVALYSHDPSTQVGCVLVRNKIPIMSGYNGFPRDTPDDHWPITRPEKYKWVKHAEANALLNCNREGICTLGATAYTSTPPCIGCYGDLWQAGIVRIVTTNFCTAKICSGDEYAKDMAFIRRVADIPMDFIPMENIDDTAFKELYEKFYNSREKG